MNAAAERRILVVDDEEGIRDLLELSLRTAGHEALTTGDARSAIAMVDDEGSIEAVIVDLNLDGMSGVEAILEIRARRPFLPILAVSGDCFDASDAIRAGANDFLAKPFELAAINAVVASLLELAARAQ